jgi:hypothetical protein
LKVVVKKMARSAVLRFARKPDAGCAFPPIACSANVPAFWVCEEDVGTFVPALCSALQPPPGGRERRQVAFILDSNQNINILGFRLFGQQGANEVDSAYARQTTDSADEVQRLAKKSALQNSGSRPQRDKRCDVALGMGSFIGGGVSTHGMHAPLSQW